MAWQRERNVELNRRQAQHSYIIGPAKKDLSSVGVADNFIGYSDPPIHEGTRRTHPMQHSDSLDTLMRQDLYMNQAR